GPAPRNAEPVSPVEERGPRSVTVPGAVAGWVELAERHGRLGLEACLADAIDAAERGFAVAPRAAAAWSAAGTSASWASALAPPPPRGGLPAPRACRDAPGGGGRRRRFLLQGRRRRRHLLGQLAGGR